MCFATLSLSALRSSQTRHLNGMAIAIPRKKIMPMQKNTIMWTAVATTAAAFIIYYFRKKKSAASKNSQKGRDKHLTDVFSRAKGLATGEYTL
jgi:hypothetical protein